MAAPITTIGELEIYEAETPVHKNRLVSLICVLCATSHKWLHCTRNLMCKRWCSCTACGNCFQCTQNPMCQRGRSLRAPLNCVQCIKNLMRAKCVSCATYLKHLQCTGIITRPRCLTCAEFHSLVPWWCKLMPTCASIVLDLADTGTDLYVGITEAEKGHYLESAFVFVFILITNVSVIIAAWLNLHHARKKHPDLYQFWFKKCVWQCASLFTPIFHQIANVHSVQNIALEIQFRKCDFASTKKQLGGAIILSKHNDALLRSLHATFESAPQLLIQTWIFQADLAELGMKFLQTFEGQVKILSLVFSTFSVALSITMHYKHFKNRHASNIFGATGESVSVNQCIAILFFRFLNVFSRTIFWFLVIVTFRFYSLFFLIGHFVAEFFLLVIHEEYLWYKSIRTFVTLLATVWISLFAPWNLTQGREKELRLFLLKYALQLFEAWIVAPWFFMSTTKSDAIVNLWKTYAFICAALAYLIGVALTVVYYRFCFIVENNGAENVETVVRNVCVIGIDISNQPNLMNYEITQPHPLRTLYKSTSV